ncbi:MAG: glycosyltransferase family 39 protein, partial [Isosphaeraceae bacterium]|nr:glycosyltransferase family 39 protein [Isosphaeraceae bacterium]
ALARPLRIITGPSLDPQAPPRGHRRLVALALALVLAVFGARCLHVARTDSITIDEATHLKRCLHFWMTGDDLVMWELGAPRLPHLLNALPSYLALLRSGLLPAAASPEAIEQLVLSGRPQVLVPARCVAIAWGMALLAVVFWAVARRRGAVAGLVAAAILSLVPEILAHASIAGSDMPFTAAAMLAVALMARYAERPTSGRWLALAGAVGLAWAMRHTALLLLPMAAGVHLWIALKGTPPSERRLLLERLWGSILASLALGLVAGLVLWAGEGFAMALLGEVADRVTTLSIPSRLGPLDLSGLPVPTAILSILKQIRHQNAGHEAYFCGQLGDQGWLLYFPVAFLLKTPVGFLALMVLAAARFRPRDRWEGLCLAFLVVLWVMLVRNKVNIGVRYALLTYPLVLPFVTRLFEPEALRDWVWTPLALGALLWLGIASAACHPRYLSYFNAIGGGPSRGWLYLADSNLDWGQDFDALIPTLKRLGITEVTTDLSSERRLEVPGLFALVYPNRTLQVPAVTPPNRRLYDAEGGYLPVHTRYVAVSASRLLGLYSHNDMSWLWTRRLLARVGDSIFVFDMDQPAAQPFID